MSYLIKSRSSLDFWSVPQQRLLQDLNATTRGLTSGEARSRLQHFGLNSALPDRTGSSLNILFRQLASPLVLVLLVAAALALFVQEWVDAALVLIIVLGSAMLGFTQEYRASKATAKLRHRLALRSNVLRDGAVVNVRASELVPGDLVLLSAGDVIPADGRVMDALDFLVSEACITGESFPVEKSPAEVPAGAGFAARTNVVYQGTSVRSGNAKVLLVNTGASTVLGTITRHAGKR
jgi:P-type Mg2+ transporter